MCSASGLPAKRIAPRHGGISPIIVFSNVLLPEPLSPTMAKISPRSISTRDAALHRRAAVADVDVVDRDGSAGVHDQMRSA
jgi:hypothetical protein